VVYRLDLPSGSKIHPAFSCFSTEESRHTLVANSKPLPNMLSEDLKLQVEPKEVKAVCINSVGNVDLLIQWKDLRYFEATWEFVYAIRQQLQLFHLEGKVKLLGGVLLIDIILNMYTLGVYIKGMPK
jgi:hypothetical protein